MRNSQIEVRPIAGAIGAEIHNVDVSRDLDEGTIGEIRKALLDHCVIFFRDQKLDADRHKSFTRRFGEIFIHPNYAGMQADPEIVVITRTPGDKRIVGEEWHADTTEYRLGLSSGVDVSQFRRVPLIELRRASECGLVESIYRWA